jgi:hypothetical protein
MQCLLTFSSPGANALIACGPSAALWSRNLIGLWSSGLWAFRLSLVLDSDVMDQDSEGVMQAVNALVDEYRTRCLWFLREDYYPQTSSDACHILEYIERHGDVNAFRRAATLRKWLLQNSSAPSAA